MLVVMRLRAKGNVKEKNIVIIINLSGTKF